MLWAAHDGLVSGGGPGLATVLASWQSIGGCGASAGAGAGAGIKWIGRGVSGGLFSVQSQAFYTPLLSDPTKVEHHFLENTLISSDLTSSWNVGVGIPFAYKYMRDPYGLTTPEGAPIDLSNSGLGDISVQNTFKLGAINATALNLSLALPTGSYDVTYKRAYLRQHQQLGFGKVGGSVTLDHTLDEIWGLIVVGAAGAWRGGENSIGNYRAPSASAWAYTGYFMGPLVPSVGLSLAGFDGHDRDRGQEENTALYSASLQVSLEWSTDWIAFLLGAVVPYQYDGVTVVDGQPRSPWGMGPWILSLGVSVAPF